MDPRANRFITILATAAILAGCTTFEATAPPAGTPEAASTPSATPAANPATPTALPGSTAEASPPATTQVPTVLGDPMGAQRAGDWPSYGFNSDNSVNNTAETQISPANVSQLKEAWHVDTGGVTGTPVIVAGICYFADWLGDVYAVDAKTSAQVWKQHVSDAPISASVALSDELVIVGDLVGGLFALRRSDGSQVWSTTVNTEEASLFASPVVINKDMVVVGMTSPAMNLSAADDSFRDSIVAYDLDGKLRWRFYTDPDNTPGLWVAVWSSAAYDAERGLIFIGIGSPNQPGGSYPVVDLPLNDGVLALHADTGTKAWFYKVVPDDGRDLDVGASPNLFSIGDRDVVGVGGKSGDYVVVDRDTGELVWREHLTEGSNGGGVMDTAAVGDGRIYVASNPNNTPASIFALNAGDGSFAWNQPQSLDTPVYGGSMALANGVLYRGPFGGPLLAFDASSGQELWRADDSYLPLGGAAAIADGMVYSGWGSGTPEAFQAPKGGLVAWELP